MRMELEYKLIKAYENGDCYFLDTIRENLKELDNSTKMRFNNRTKLETLLDTAEKLNDIIIDLDNGFLDGDYYSSVMHALREVISNLATYLGLDMSNIG